MDTVGELDLWMPLEASMFKDVADRLRMEWGDRADVRLVVTKDFTMALFHKTKKEHDRDVWKGTGIFKCGELYFVPTESRKSRGLFTAFTEMLAKHRIALAKIADQVSMVSQILTHRSPHMRVLHGPNMSSLVESWDETDTPWPAILTWYHADGQNLLQGGPASDTGVWPSIVALLADLLESIPNPTSPREGTTKTTQKTRGPKPDPAKDDIERLHEKGTVGTADIVEILDLKKRNGKSPEKRVRNVINAMTQRQGRRNRGV